MAAHFGDDLQFSHDQSGAPFWEEVYRSAFPDFAAMVNVRKDGWAQRGGIDRVVTTASGVTWWIDEKVRREKWPDILLEFCADKGRDEPGWIVKDLACHYIAYGVLPTKECFLLPVAPLQAAWRKWGEHWKRQYGMKSAPNSYRGRRWVTLSCPVPVAELMHRISQAMYITWQSEPLLDMPAESEMHGQGCLSANAGAFAGVE